jgi:phosphohistidine phosphatase
LKKQFVTLVRHAKSSWNNADQADHDRPLNRRGMLDGPEMANRLLSRQCIPDLLLCSTARRAQETSAYLKTAFRLAPEQFKLIEDLYLATPKTLLETLARVPNTVQHVMIVGHNPGLEELSEQLAGQALPPFPTLGVRHYSCTSIRELVERHLALRQDTHKRHARNTSDLDLETRETSTGHPNSAKANLLFDDYPKAVGKST